ncbi:MAG TPA: OsmC family protein [Burkholderiaceae bacterium]|nr:OsmC family protein [Burkholderiaceae bacterium]HRA77932.1 OsmC family protein [Burkholderiaceae bacterium]
MSSESITIRLAQRHDYQFELQFGAGVPALRGDEPPPLGQGAGPSPMQLLASAVGNCLSSSLLFALRKFKQAPEPLSAEVTAEVGRNDANRLRVLAIRAKLTLGVPAGTLEHLDRVLGQFEQFCTVTQSVAAGIPVTVQVFDSEGTQLK